MRSTIRPVALVAAAVLFANGVAAQRSSPSATESLRAGFGAAVAVANGQVYVGEPSNRFRSGVVYVYAAGDRRRATGGWREVARVTAPDSATGDRFGRSVAADGDRLLVGADPEFGRAAGVVHAFVRRNGKWAAEQLLLALDGEPKDGFGTTLLIHGDMALVGAPGRTGGVGGVFAYASRNGRWELVATMAPEDTAGVRGYGSALAMDGDWMLIGAPGSDRGAGRAFAYHRVGGRWEPTRALARDGAADTTAAFGSAVAITGSRAFVGAPGAGSNLGGVTQFTLDTARMTWRARGELQPFDAVRNGHFGAALAADGDGLWVGTPSAAGAGAVHRYALAGDGRLAGLATFVAPEQFVDRNYGDAVAVQGDLAVVGVSGYAIGAGRALIVRRGTAGWTEDTSVVSPPEALPSLMGDEIRCQQGEARLWDCNNVDLVSFLPVSAIGGVRGMRLNDLWGWTDSATGREYALIGRSDGTSFVDMSDAAHPRYLGDLPMTPGAHAAVWRDIKVYRDHAYIVSDGAGQHGVQVFDLHRLRNLKAPQTFAPDYLYPDIWSAHNVVIDEETGFGYVVGASAGGTTCDGGLHMMDLHQPARPTFAGCFADGITGRRGTGYIHDAQCLVYRGPDRDYAGHEICISANETAISLTDVSDKKAPRSISTVSYPNVAYAHQGWLSDDQRFFFSNDEIDEANGSEPHTRTLVWDLTDLDDPLLVKEYKQTTTETDHNLYVRGRYMYQSNTGAGLRVIDVSDPVNPREVGFFDTDREGTGGGTWSNYPFFKSGVIPVTGGFAGIFFVRPRAEAVP